MNEKMLWYGWVKACPQHVSLLDALDVEGLKRYDKKREVIEYCVVDDAGLARLIRYWPKSEEWPEYDRHWGVEESFTLMDSHGIQADREIQRATLDKVRKMAAALPDREWSHEIGNRSPIA